MVAGSVLGVDGAAASRIWRRSLARVDLFFEPRGRPRVGLGLGSAIFAGDGGARTIVSSDCGAACVVLCDFLGRPRPRFEIAGVDAIECDAWSLSIAWPALGADMVVTVLVSLCVYRWYGMYWCRVQQSDEIW